MGDDGARGFTNVQMPQSNTNYFNKPSSYSYSSTPRVLTDRQQSLKVHAHETAKDLVIANAGITIMIIAALIFFVVVFAIATLYYRHEYIKYAPATATKASFGIRSVNNRTHGGSNPQWQYGGDHAGYGGSMHRETTGTQAAALMPHLRRTAAVEHDHMHGGFREHLATSPTTGPTPAATPTTTGCPAGTTGVTYQDPDSGALLSHCTPSPGSKAGGATWAGAATTEAQQLASMGAIGSFGSDHFGEAALMRAIDSNMSSSTVSVAATSDVQAADTM